MSAVPYILGEVVADKHGNLFRREDGRKATWEPGKFEPMESTGSGEPGPPGTTDWDGLTNVPAVIAAGDDAAAARTVISAERAVTFNVKDYGAVGDGTANDTAAIQAALDAASTAGGGTVFLPRGVYKLAGKIKLGDNVALEGVGAQSVLKPEFTSVINRVIWNDWTAGNTNITLRNFKLDRSYGAPNVQHGILLNGVDGLLVDGVVFTGIAAINGAGALNVSGILDTGITHLVSRNVRVVNCQFNDTGNYGVQVGYVDGCVISNNTAYNASREVFATEPEEDCIASNVVISNNTVFGSTVMNGTSTGLIIATENTGGLVQGCTIQGNTLTQPVGGNTGNYGITVSGGDGIAVTGNTIRGVDGSGIVLGITGFNVTNGAVVQGNTVIDCGRGSGGTSPGIRLRNSTRCSIIGNYVYGTNHTAGVSEQTGATGNMIALNYLRDTVPITTPAVGTFVFGNKNTDAENAAVLAPGADLKLFNTEDQVTNYEQAHGHWSSNTFILNTEAGGTGTVRDVALRSGPTNGVLVSAGSTKVTATGTTGSTTGIIALVNGTLSAASGVAAGLRVSPTLTQTGTAAYTALLINPTETTTGSGAKLLADFQVGGSSKAKIDNTGVVSAAPSTAAGTAMVRVAVPASATAAGVTGSFAADASFFYYCSAANTWVRSAHATW